MLKVHFKKEIGFALQIPILCQHIIAQMSCFEHKYMALRATTEIKYSIHYDCIY
jgi:hypothetical protein